MTAGSSFYRAMSTGLVAGMLFVPSSTYYDNTPKIEKAAAPWTMKELGLSYQSPLRSRAGGIADYGLSYVQAANVYRTEYGAPTGAFGWSAIASFSPLSPTTELLCSISTDNSTVCEFTPAANISRHLVASEMNQRHGLEIAGIFDGTSLVAPSGTTINMPPGTNPSVGALVIVRRGR